MIFYSPNFFEKNKLNIFVPASFRGETASEIFNCYLDNLTEGVKVCENSMPYLRLFLNLEPSICERVVRDYYYGALSLKTEWGSEYISLLNKMAAWLLDNGQIKEGLFWAKKSIDVLTYFNPSLEGEKLEYEIKESTGIIMIWELLPQFNEGLYNRVFLEWEIKRQKTYQGKSHLNDNYLIKNPV